MFISLNTCLLLTYLIWLIIPYNYEYFDQKQRQNHSTAVFSVQYTVSHTNSAITSVSVTSFTASIGSFIINIICLAVGIVAALALDKFNQSVEKPE